MEGIPLSSTALLSVVIWFDTEAVLPWSSLTYRPLIWHGLVYLLSPGSLVGELVGWGCCHLFPLFLSSWVVNSIAFAQHCDPWLITCISLYGFLCSVWYWIMYTVTLPAPCCSWLVALLSPPLPSPPHGSVWFIINQMYCSSHGISLWASLLNSHVFC